MAYGSDLIALRAAFEFRGMCIGGGWPEGRSPGGKTPSHLYSEFEFGDVDSIIANYCLRLKRGWQSVFVVKLLDGRFGVIKSFRDSTITEGSVLWSSAIERSVDEIISKHLTREEVLELGLEDRDG
jgi:hypothetical protein